MTMKDRVDIDKDSWLLVNQDEATARLFTRSASVAAQFGMLYQLLREKDVSCGIHHREDKGDVSLVFSLARHSDASHGQ